VGNPFRVNAASYGVRGVDADPLEITQKPLSGMYAVSAHYVARVPVYPGANDWLRRFQPIAVIGHALYIYEIP
jgi:hypothetical protein